MRLSDCTCTICLNILVEPVTLPCDHELCMPCFKQHVAETSLFCPLCRTRLSVWARRAARQNKLVNETRWKQIREAFPEQVQNRLEGKDDIDEDDDDDFFIPNIAEPGELRKEYEEERSKIRAERAESEREAEEASLQLIAELQAQEAKRREQEKKDLELAAAISREINGVTPQVYHTETASKGSSLASTPKAPPKPVISTNTATTLGHQRAPRPPMSSPRNHGNTQSKTVNRSVALGANRTTSPRATSSSKASATKTSSSSQGHLQMWYKPKPKEHTQLDSATSAVVRTTLLSPRAMADRIQAVRNGEDPSSVGRTEKRSWNQESDEEDLGNQAGTSSGTSTLNKTDWSRKCLCLTDVSNKSKT